MKVVFEDKQLEYDIRKNINKLNIDNIEKIYLYNSKISDLTSLKKFKNLKTSGFFANKIEDITPVKYLRKLIEPINFLLLVMYWM